MLKRPQKRLLRADAAKRAAFVAFHLALRQEAERVGATIFCVDEAHIRADADLRGKWVLKGEPALVGSTSPGLTEKVVHDSAVGLETGAVEEMPLWAGESVSAAKRVQPAAEIVRELAEEAEELLRRW